MSAELQAVLLEAIHLVTAHYRIEDDKTIYFVDSKGMLLGKIINVG